MEERACPSCGAQNPVAAEYCWQCFTRFAGPSPGTTQGTPSRGSALAAAIGTGPGAGTPSAVVTEPATMTRWQPQTPTRDRVAGWAVKALVVALAALLGFIGNRWLTGGLELPERVGGEPRMEGDIVGEFEDLLSGFGSAFDIEVKTALYGNIVPTYYIAAAEVPDDQDIGQAYQDFVEGSMTSTVPVDPGVATCVASPIGLGAQCTWLQEDDRVIVLLNGYTSTDTGLQAVAEDVRSDLA